MVYTVRLRGGGHAVKVFEAPDSYLEQNTRRGVWGEVTSSIDWCERNYVWTPYIAELWNTISNIALIIAGVAGLVACSRLQLEPRFYLMFSLIILVGFGSAAFHGMLLHASQQLDETPMILCISVWLFCFINVDAKAEKTTGRFRYWASGLFLGAMCATFTVTHYIMSFVLVFQVLFGIIVVAALTYLVRSMLRLEAGHAKTTAILYVFYLALAFTIWLIDQHFCESLYSLPYGVPNPQFHAWWHLFNGFTCWYGPIYLVYLRERARGHSVVMKVACLGLVPYVSYAKTE